MARKSSFDANSLVEGALSGIISKINDRAEREQEKVKLQRDILSYAVKEKIKNRMESGREKERMNWFEDMMGGAGGQRNFVKETNTPMTGIADLFSKSGGRTGQAPYAMTEETETGERRPMMTQDIDYEGLGRAQTPTISSTGIGAKPMASNDRMYAMYNGLKKIEESGRSLNPQQAYIKQGLERKLFGVGVEKTADLTQAKRKIIGEIRGLKNANASAEDINEHIRLQGYEPEDFSDELNDYSPTQQLSVLEKAKQVLLNSPIKTVSQAVNYLMQTYRVNKDKAIEMLKGMQEE